MLQAARTGNVTAELNLGKLYYSGIGGKPNYPEAGKWFVKAAGHRSEEAKAFLQLMKQNGQFDSKTL
ncbi:hypothetical protein MPLDJ20_110260 [Mesorhizobium plurifarium]|uniref:Sel1 domain protein repeat-containing protein n=1 Tax=Mesorhizobium plurifarium TaxID=69974 RepID=A0A090DXV2_MESPL|nr:hypothetical protein MPLDJ20_110260 [Mesorhizobium plurifarium]